MMRQLLERLEAQTKTGVTLRVLSGGKDPAGMGQTVATPPPMAASPAQGMAAVARGAQQQALPKAQDARFYVDAAAGLAVGETVERNGMRLQRFRPSLRVTDLANAGKRGKGCPQFALYDLDYPFQAAKAAAAVSAALKAIAKAPTYAKAVAIAREAAAPRGQGGVGFQEQVLRGVDVEPAVGGSGARIAIETPTFGLEASLVDFMVTEKQRPGPGGDDTRILGAPYGGAKKAAIKAFYAWVQAHEAEIKRMTFRELSLALADAGLAYHSFSTMD